MAEELATARMPIVVLDALASSRLALWVPSMRLGHSGSSESRHSLIANYFPGRSGGVRWCVVAGDERRRDRGRHREKLDDTLDAAGVELLCREWTDREDGYCPRKGVHEMGDAIVFHRLQFAFTIIYHYLFPQLTMGLALLIVLMKARGFARDGERWNDAARFWIRIFGINFAVGVVTGIPMEFQFGTNWATFSRYTGNVIGQTLAM